MVKNDATNYKTVILLTPKVLDHLHTVFIRSDVAATIIFAARLSAVLIEGCVYFLKSSQTSTMAGLGTYGDTATTDRRCQYSSHSLSVCCQ